MTIQTKKTFTKTALSIDEQLTLLSSRGLKGDYDKLRHYLTYVGYYRLSAYMLPFQDEKNNFVKPCYFEDVLNLYLFDKKLRQLSFGAVKQVEIALKAVINNKMSAEYGVYWFNKPDLFDQKNPTSFQKALNIIRRATVDCPDDKKALFVKQYYEKYGSPELPPSWIVFEALSMGEVSRVFKLLGKPHRKAIAGYFGIDEFYLASWFHVLTHTRNLCAHHQRLWNKVFSITPKINRHFQPFNTIEFPEKFYVQTVIIETLLNKIDPGSNWKTDLTNLIKAHRINIESMGFPRQA